MLGIPKKELSLFDSTCIIVGIIVGAGIYETAPVVAGCMGTSPGILAIWFAGGVLALAGSLCFAELATAYPREGGEYVYLNRAYGPWAGYLFGWSQLIIIRPGDIALMAFVFARYAATLYAPGQHADLVYAALAVSVLTAINVAGVRGGKWTHLNLLTVAKAAGLLAIVAGGFLAPDAPHVPQDSSSATFGGVKLALILVMFTYGGWNEMACVSAEVKRPERNIVRALALGTGGVILLYLLTNAAYIAALGPTGTAESQAVAVDTLARLLPDTAARAVSVFICISALGAVNGLIFTGSRISYAMGADHRLFGKLGQWDKKLGTPVWALGAAGRPQPHHHRRCRFLRRHDPVRRASRLALLPRHGHFGVCSSQDRSRNQPAIQSDRFPRHDGALLRVLRFHAVQLHHLRIHPETRRAPCFRYCDGPGRHPLCRRSQEHH